jgi:hypothetical protein
VDHTQKVLRTKQHDIFQTDGLHLRFLFLVQETPLFAIQVMKTMADRLRRVDLLIAESDQPPSPDIV